MSCLIIQVVLPPAPSNSSSEPQQIYQTQQQQPRIAPPTSQPPMAHPQAAAAVPSSVQQPLHVHPNAPAVAAAPGLSAAQVNQLAQQQSLGGGGVAPGSGLPAIATAGFVDGASGGSGGSVAQGAVGGGRHPHHVHSTQPQHVIDNEHLVERLEEISSIQQGSPDDAVEDPER